MTDELKKMIDDVKAKRADAVSGPYNVFGGGGCVSIGVRNQSEIAPAIRGSTYGDGYNQNAKNYVALATCFNAMPALLAEVERLRQVERAYLVDIKRNFVPPAALAAASEKEGER